MLLRGFFMKCKIQIVTIDEVQMRIRRIVIILGSVMPDIDLAVIALKAMNSPTKPVVTETMNEI